MKGKFMTLKKAIPAALIVAGSMGLASNASASAYGVSYNNVFNLSVTSTDGVGEGGPFFVPLTDFYSFTTTTTSAATRGPFGGPGAGETNSANANGPSDALVSVGTGSVFPGGVPANNAMTAVGQVGDYSYGDAQISTTAIEQVGGVVSATGDLTQAWNIAEGFVPASGLATANATNSSTTGFDTEFESTGDSIFQFDFSADPYMMVELGALADAGSSALATLRVNFSITDQDSGELVFNWTPNGAAGGIFGGIELQDDLDLSETISVNAAGASADYDPLGNGAPTGNIAPGSFGSFSARTGVLAAGNYSLSLSMVEEINISSTVPAPGILALMGLGLAGLGFSRRRKAS